MQGKTSPRWMELCEQAAKEQGPQAFLFMPRELVSMLEEKGQRLSKHFRLVTCWLCGKPLPLENGKADDRGRTRRSPVLA